ncbi:flagellin [Anaerovibrio sp. RM50]|uniref:flagellin N-terminal helical domain-containing protein n=1 Tax=Anaerovibrio sp. RM50 TaxID=1200557 RepID=UPI000489B868|nr:flagellin [Anaerovibrio sp. RM50]
MGMVIYNNLPAMSILNENNKNLKKATKAMGQLSLGEKIRNAGDDAATYAITEKMKGKIRAIDQCHANSDKGKSMLDLASAAVDEQVNIMKQVKVCALRATDGTYTDIDRATIQKEVAQMLDQSDTIAHQTTFNGIQLLNQRTLSRRDYWFDSSAPYKPNKDNTPVLTQAVGGKYKETMGTYYPLDSGMGYDQNSLHGGSNLTSLPSVGDWVWDSASNSVKQVTQDSTGTLLIGGTRVTVNGKSNPPGNPPDSSTNVKAPELDLRTTPPNVGSQVAISKKPSFDSSGNVLTETVTETPGSHVLSYFKPVADQVYGSGPSATELDFSALQGAVSSLGDLDGKGFSMECGGCQQFVTIMFDASSNETKRYEGSSGSPKPLSYVVGVAGVDMSDLSNSLMQTIFNGIAGSNKLPSATDTSATITSLHNIQLNYYASTGKFTISKNGPYIRFMNGIRGEMVEEDYYQPYQIKALQTDITSAQFTKVKLPTTTLDALFPAPGDRWDTDIASSDWPTKWPKGYDLLTEDEKKQRWAEEVWQYPVKIQKLDVDTCVATMEKANVFLSQVDQAIKFLLNSNTTLGAESARLNFTMDNLTTRSENETSAESVMRDTDVAKSYTDYMTSNILSQASQAMLAQANKNSQDVLSLLQ